MEKEKIKNWLKDKYNLTFLGLIIFAICLRFYFFVLTKNQPLWWDEADYLAYAKNLANLGVSWVVTAKHNSLFPILASLIFRIGLGETTIKFLFQFVPSILTIIIVYLLSNEMYKDKKVGLISAFLMAVLWNHIFNTTRFHVGIPALFTGLLAIYVFWKGYENKEKLFGKINPKYTIPLTVFFVMLTYMIRRGYFLFGLFIFTYLVLTKKWKMLVKDKYNWIGLILAISLFFIAENLIFSSQISGVAEGYFHKENPINFLPLNIFKAYFSFGTALSSILFYLFLIGLFLTIGKLAIMYGHIKKDEMSKSNLFNLITIFITLFFFIYILRTPGTFGEPRWYYPLLFSSLILISTTGLFFTNYLKKYNKRIAVVFLIVIIGMGGYSQINAGDITIKNKLNSFSGIKDASLFINEISDKEDLILTLGMPQVEYYSERKTVHAREWVKDDPKSLLHFAESIKDLKNNKRIKYILISFSEPNYPEWMQKIYHNQEGNLIAWEIPFMETKIDFINQQENELKQSRTYDTLTFNLLTIKEEVFVYEITHKNA
jgi:hypothetical protein